MPNPTITFTSDTYINSLSTLTNYDATGTLYVDMIYVNEVKDRQCRTILKVQIPPEIKSPEVYKAYLQGIMMSGTAGVEATVYRMDSGSDAAYWNEAQATWNSRTTGVAWTNLGGDYTDPHAHFTATFAGGAGDCLQVDITELVIDAIDNRGGLLDLLIRLDDEAPEETVQICLATENEPQTGGTHWPRLLIVRPPFGMPMAV